MIIGKFLLEILVVLIFLSIVSTLVMYHFGIGVRGRSHKKRSNQDSSKRDP